jgi:hypothetical protein
VGEPWRDNGQIGTTHAYDMATLDGGDLWLVGSLSYAASAWRSKDDGETWEQSLSVAALDSEEFARFYFAGVLEGRLYLQAIDSQSGQHPGSVVFDGTRWMEGPDLLLGLGAGWRPIEYGGRMVYRARRTGGALLAFDGQEAKIAVDWIAYDLAVEDGLLYLLAWHIDDSTGARGRTGVIRTANLRVWHELASPAPDDSISLAVLDGEIYLGAKYAEIWRLEGDPEWRPAAVPPMSWSVLLPYSVSR